MINEKKLRGEIGYYVGLVIKRKLTERELEKLDNFIVNKLLLTEVKRNG